ncbi:hypothetical protein KEM48_001283 [Puccinia striiformis f. sp. tritici PST-130]|nr:hypothetical protein KEM48_001283 [Puccinia striiformis f. sp. tritici PST-130]
MARWSLFLLLAGKSFGLDSPPPGLSKRAHGGDLSLPSLHTISIEPSWPSGSVPALSRSGILANTPPTVHRDSDGPGGAIELQQQLNDRKERTRYQHQAAKAQLFASSIMEARQRWTWSVPFAWKNSIVRR